ncbi:MAG: hypothetical protein QOH59_2523, partial [Gemmatimonadales bacterium]|nr:hypothetical protein [Gemmatimonadales bacterium]
MYQRRRPGRASDAHEESFLLATEALAGFLYDFDIATGHVRRFGGSGDILGFTLGEVPPTPHWWLDRIHPEEIARVFRDAKAVFEGTGSEYYHEYRLKHKKGYYITIGDRGRLIRDGAGQPIRAVGGVVDITERALLREREQQARSAATAANQARDEMLRLVSHDLRTPLSTIAISASAISATQDPSPEHVREVLAAIRRSAEWMDRLICDFIDVATIEGGGMSIRMAQVTPEGIVEAAAELVAAEARERGVLLELRIPRALRAIYADSDRVLQALVNLLKNSLKFTSRGGRITLRAEQLESGILFSVEDTGAGIEAADLPHIFERYWQKQRGGEAGTGLGLAIVRGIVDAHSGGEVGV